MLFENQICSKYKVNQLNKYQNKTDFCAQEIHWKGNARNAWVSMVTKWKEHTDKKLENIINNVGCRSIVDGDGVKIMTLKHTFLR